MTAQDAWRRSHCVGEEPVLAVRLGEPVATAAEALDALLSGRAKRELVQWWLALCEARATAYLAQRGLAAGVLPYNYLDTPPASLRAVRTNLEVLDSVLGSGLPEFYERVVRPVAAVVYARADRFAAMAETAAQRVLS